MDDTLKSLPVWTPPGDRAVDFDTAVDLRLRSLAWTRRMLISGVVSQVVLAVFVLLPGDPWYGAGVGLLVFALFTLGRLVLFQLRWGRWMGAARTILGVVTARRVTAEVITWKGQNVVLSLDGGQSRVRVGSVHPTVRAVIARTGEVWLAGPDERGIAFVFANGLPVPLHAKVITEAPAPRTPEPPPPASMLVADDALPLAYARRLAAIQGAQLAALLVFAAAAITWGGPTHSLRIAYGVFIGLIVISGFVRLAPTLRLPALFKDGRWQSFQARTNTWTGDPKPTGALGVTITLPDGTELPAVIKIAPAELVANIVETGLIWINGTPMLEDTRAVGLPGHPIAAAAKFVRHPKLH
ncbi:hypothetical protein [Actinocrispum sp. NPDC049592]|uniref:hypothetical protein n=1 Tax=Actinocrispum sp. NPDC049592 TaxID=3154835 RepID=UPI003424DA62